MTASSTIIKLQEAVTLCRNEVFIKPETASDFDALGILIANYCKWQGKNMQEVVYSMLEDANFHTLNKQIEEVWNKKAEAVK